MKTLYFDLGMGAAGDMLTAALLELLPERDQEEFLEEMNRLGIPGVTVTRNFVRRSGILGSRMHVLINGVEEGEEDLHGDDMHHRHHHGDDSNQEHHGHHHGHDAHHSHGGDHHHEHGHTHHHAGMHDIEQIVEGLDLDGSVKKDILAVYGLIAEAESRVHGMPVTEIHFHEVGMMDAVADVTAVCMLMHRLSPERVIASPVHVGSGHVHCAHGIMPVPAPATAYILRGVPMYGGEIRGELCTPTGAALIRHFADSFDNMPVMTVKMIGCGMGEKEFSQMNCVRALLGDVKEKQESAGKDKVLELVCNIDDMTGEEIGFAEQELLRAGAREVFTVTAQMKKSRPGIVLHVITDPERKEEMVRHIFSLTSTIGIRAASYERYVLDRREETVTTRFGKVRRKISSGYGVERIKWEYDDMEAVAGEHGMNIREVRDILDISADNEN